MHVPFDRTARLAAAASVLTLLAACAASPGRGELQKEDPARGSARRGEVIHVDDGTCPAGEVKRIIGGNQSAGVARQTTCVKRPG